MGPGSQWQNLLFNSTFHISEHFKTSIILGFTSSKAYFAANIHLLEEDWKQIFHTVIQGGKKKKTTQKPPRLYDKRHLPSFMAKCSFSNWEQGLWNQESCLKHSSSSKYCNCTNQLCLKQIEMLHWLRFTIYRYVTFGGFQSSENNEKATRDFVISYLPQLGPC